MNRHPSHLLPFDAPTGTGSAPRLRRPKPEVLRRRRAAVLLGVGLLTLTGVGVASAASTRVGPPETTIHVVLPGESLWSIAREVKPKGDIRSLVNKLGHQVRGSQLQPGDELVVPASKP
jgi:hypothetical protein